MNTEKLLVAHGLTKSYARSGAEDVAGGARFAAGAVDSIYVGGSNANYYRVLRLR